MTRERTIIVVGGTSGIGRAVSSELVRRGDRVVLTGRDLDGAERVAAELGERASGRAIDLAQPRAIREGLRGVESVDGIVLCAVERDASSVASFDVEKAIRLSTLKLVGYLEVIHVLSERLTRSADTGIVLFGGIARSRPYPGSLMVSTVNGGVEGMAVALAKELSPIRVNVIHPGIIGDSPFWSDKEAALEGYRARTPGGELATVADVVETTIFLLMAKGVSAATVNVDRATLTT